MTRDTASRPTPPADDKAGDSSSPALRLIALLEHVARADKALTLTEIIGQVRQPKPTVYRMLQQLEQAGLLVKEPDGKRYAPGARLAKLAEDVLLNAQVRAARHAILQRLVDELGETCNYTMPAGTEVVYLDRVETAWPLRFHLQPGSRVPLHCSASGKLFLAYMAPVQRNRLLDHLQYKGYTPNTITTRIRLEAELARIRAQGYALDNEEYLDGLVCIAVPVFDPRNRQKVRGSVAVQAPASRLPVDRATSALPALQRTALAFGRSIGDSGLERTASKPVAVLNPVAKTTLRKTSATKKPATVSASAKKRAPSHGRRT
jgi:IclR family transcriptional regulator, acetate operon repressor